MGLYMGQEGEKPSGYMTIQMDDLLQMPNTFIVLVLRHNADRTEQGSSYLVSTRQH